MLMYLSYVLPASETGDPPANFSELLTVQCALLHDCNSCSYYLGQRYTWVLHGNNTLI